MAARTSPEPASQRPCSASRAHPPGVARCTPEGALRSDRTSGGRRSTLPRRVWLFGGSRPRSNRCCLRGGNSSEGALAEASFDLLALRTARPSADTRSTSSHEPRPTSTRTQLLFGPGTPGTHPQGEGASPFRSGRRPVQLRRTRGPSRLETGPWRGRSSVRCARQKALGSSGQRRTPVSASLQPPIPAEPKLFGSGDRAAHGRSSSVCTIRRRFRAQSSGSKLPGPWAFDPPDAARHEARRCRKANHAERCRALSALRPATRFKRRRRTSVAVGTGCPSLAATRVASPGSALPVAGLSGCASGRQR